VRTVVKVGDNQKFELPRAVGPDAAVSVRSIGFKDRFVTEIQACGDLRIANSDAERLGPVETARQLPADQWLALWKKSPAVRAMSTAEQEKLSGGMIRSCLYCHQFGGPSTQGPRSHQDWLRLIDKVAYKDLWIKKFGQVAFMESLVSWGNTLNAHEFPALEPFLLSGIASEYRFEEWDVSRHHGWVRDVAVNYRFDPKILPKAPKGERGNWVYITEMGRGELIAVEPVTGKVRSWKIPTDVPGGTWSFRGSKSLPWTSVPHEVEVERDGNLIVTADIDKADPAVKPNTGGNHDLIRFDPATEQWTSIKNSCHSLNARLGPDGRIWTTGTSGKVCVYSDAGEKVMSFAENPRYEDFVYGLTVTEKGIVAGSQPYDHKLVIVKNDHLRQVPIPHPGRFPGNLDHDSTGAIWISFSNGYVGRYRPEKNKFEFWALPVPRSEFGVADVPFSVVVDRFGLMGVKDTVYVAMVNSDSILALHPKTGKFARYLNPTKGFFVREMEIGADGIYTVFSGEPYRLAEKAFNQKEFVPRLSRLQPRKAKP